MESAQSSLSNGADRISQIRWQLAGHALRGSPRAYGDTSSIKGIGKVVYVSLISLSSNRTSSGQ
jgi:hypothetical protein